MRKASDLIRIVRFDNTDVGDKDDRTVYVGGIPADQVHIGIPMHLAFQWTTKPAFLVTSPCPQCNDYSLQALFGECGKIRDTRIIRDKATPLTN